MIVGFCGKKVETIQQLIPLVQESSLTQRFLDVDRMENTEPENSEQTLPKEVSEQTETDGSTEVQKKRALVGEHDEEHYHRFSPDEILKIVEKMQGRIKKVGFPNGRRLGLQLMEGPACVIVTKVLDQSPLMGK